MGKIDAKFRKAASDIGHVIPDVDDPFWNFYRNVSMSPKPDIAIPVTFLNGKDGVATAHFRSLGSPYDLQGLAVDQTVKSLHIRNPGLKWTALSVNHSPPIPAHQLDQWLARNPLVQSASLAAPSLFAAFTCFSETLRGLHTDLPLADIRATLKQAQNDFVAAVTLQYCQVDWPQDSLRLKLQRVLGLS